MRFCVNLLMKLCIPGQSTLSGYQFSMLYNMMKSNTKVIFLIMLIFFLYYVFSLLFLNECIYYWVINKVSYTSSNDYRTPFNIDCWKFLESKYMQKVKLYLHYSPIRSKHFSENEIQGYYYISAPISRSNFRKTCATFS